MPNDICSIQQKYIVENNIGLPVWGIWQSTILRAASVYVLTGRCHIIALTEEVQTLPHTGTLPGQQGHVLSLKQRRLCKLPIPHIPDQ